MAKRRVLVLSDVSVGYAVPQMILMAQGIGNLLDADVTLVEPDMKGRLELCEADGIEFRRISTRNPPHDLVFHVEYVRAMNEIYREIQPDVLLVFNAAVLPPLLLNSHRPECVIYYMLESLDHQLSVGGQHFLDLNRMATELIDLVVVPERRRYAVDAARLGWEDLPMLEVLNIGSAIIPRTSFPDSCRFLFAGTLSKHTALDWLSDERLSHLDIDIAGPCDSEESRTLVNDFLAASKGRSGRRYLGLLTHGQLVSRLQDYAYRLVFWTANDINTLYASPNKFFESISCCLPPLSTPHPQMVDINRQYCCSVLSDNFSRDAAIDAILRAADIYYSDAYLELLNGCISASYDALNWPRQFGMVAKFLRKRFSTAEAETVSTNFELNELRQEKARIKSIWRKHDSGHHQDKATELRQDTRLAANDRNDSSEPKSRQSGQALDPDWYVRTYPDVRSLGMTAQEHFEWIGRALGRSPNANAAIRHNKHPSTH